MKKRKLMIIFFLSIFVILLMVFFLPVKKALKYNDLPTNKGEYFICEQQSVTGPNWIVVGDENGLFPQGKCFSVMIEGVDPQTKLVRSLQLDASNKYIIYGNVSSKGVFYDEEYPVITSYGFDIFYPIDRGNSFRFFAPKNYLTLLDFDWFIKN